MSEGRTFSQKVVHGEALVTSNSGANAYDVLWVGTGGDIAVTHRKRPTTTVVYENVPTGWFALVSSKVLTTSTTAAAMVGCITGV